MAKVKVRKEAAKPAVEEDVWIPTTCAMCYALCAIKVHRVNGVVVKIEGDPDSPISSGRLCPKGVAGIMTLYDPNRLDKPLKRTNPEKGIGVDPGWVEIGWDEALDIVVERLKKIRGEDPRKLFYQGTTTVVSVMGLAGFYTTAALGSPNIWCAGGGLHCGNGAHIIHGIMHASWSAVPDFDYCNYALYFGASKGHGAGHIANANAQKASEARVRGMKLVVVDPMCNFASAKATEWVPIRVGTDAALALSMINVLLNELGIYDARYLKRHTNAPYLVKADGHYVRDEESKQPLVWDAREGKAKVFNDTTIQDYALLGDYEVNGIPCQPAFQVLKEHVKKYTPEYASEITTIAPERIRRLAREFGTEARVGSTIVIDGKELPYRPVAAIFFRGSQGHKNSLYNAISISLLNQIVGAADVPGAAMGFSPVCFGYPDTQKPYYVPRPGPDGLMIVGNWVNPHIPYPPSEAKPPQSMSLRELFPLAMFSPTMVSSDQEEIWQKFGLPYRPEVMINMGANGIMTVGNSQVVAESLKKIDFIVSFDLFLTEFDDFADLVLPDACHLERLFPSATFPFIFAHPSGMGEWSWTIQQPAIEPIEERRDYTDVMREIVYRIGGDVQATWHFILNRFYDLRDQYKLAPNQQYTLEEMSDRILKSQFGEERGLEYFKEHGHINWPKKVEEVYWRPFLPVRVPIYFEFLKTVGEQTKQIADSFGMELDYKPFEPVPDWLPCASHEEQSPELDLWAFYYRDVLHTNSFTMENPWLDEAARMNPYSYTICLNARTAASKGIKDEDVIVLQTKKGRRVEGLARLSECIHPESVGIAACAGHWTPHQPIARGKGIFYNELLEVDLEHAAHVNLNLDLCVKVKVTKKGR
jgi:molybdopterin-containing oxidoreductase family molybdopterin binding subunit